MTGLIINIVLAVLLIGAVLYIFSKAAEHKSLEDDFYELAKTHEQVYAELEKIRRENNKLLKENSELDKVPKKERVRKTPTKRKTTKK